MKIRCGHCGGDAIPQAALGRLVHCRCTKCQRVTSGVADDETLEKVKEELRRQRKVSRDAA